MRRIGAGLVWALLMTVQPQGLAAQAADPSTIVILDQEQLFSGTEYGRALEATLQAQKEALLEENRKIDAALEAEERDLTERRSGLPAEEFHLLAEAFDKKANELRNAQEAKSRDLTRLRDEQRQVFFQNIGPIIGDYMVERGAVVVLDKTTVIISLGSIDITAKVIEKINAKLGDGSALLKP